MDSKRSINCCEATNNAIGEFYENRAKISERRSSEIVENFSCNPSELPARSGIIFIFLRDLTVAILAKFAALSDPAVCKSICCESAARAIQQIGTAYTTDIYNAVSSIAFSIETLTVLVVPGLIQGYINALNAVVLASPCNNGGCGCRSKK